MLGHSGHRRLLKHGETIATILSTCAVRSSKSINNSMPSQTRMPKGSCDCMPKGRVLATPPILQAAPTGPPTANVLQICNKISCCLAQLNQCRGCCGWQLTHDKTDTNTNTRSTTWAVGAVGESIQLACDVLPSGQKLCMPTSPEHLDILDHRHDRRSCHHALHTGYCYIMVKGRGSACHAVNMPW